MFQFFLGPYNVNKWIIKADSGELILFVESKEVVDFFVDKVHVNLTFAVSVYHNNLCCDISRQDTYNGVEGIRQLCRKARVSAILYNYNAVNTPFILNHLFDYF